MGWGPGSNARGRVTTGSKAVPRAGRARGGKAMLGRRLPVLRPANSRSGWAAQGWAAEGVWVRHDTQDETSGANRRTRERETRVRYGRGDGA